jgi:Sap-like sulfolipid-1-addressing protein
MKAQLLTMAGLACLDALNVLNIGVMSAVVYDARLGRRSPLPGGLSFIAGVFTMMSAFGIATVLGLSLLTDLFDFKVTPTLRFWGALVLGLVLVALAFFPLTSQTAAPGWAMAAVRRRPWLLGGLGAAIGIGQAPTSVAYLTALALLANLHPRPAAWPAIVMVYCVITLTAPILILTLATRKDPRANRIQRRLVRFLTRYGPISVRILFLVVGVVLITDALVHHSVLW